MKKPKWVSDSEVKVCPICAVEFSLIKRKHHCRSCGNIFCDPCSRTKRPLKSIGIVESVRLCDICAKDYNVPYQSTQITHAAVVKRWVNLCTTVSDNTELIKEVIQGIPNTLRGIIWAELTNTCDLIQKNVGIYDLYKTAKPLDSTLTHLELDVPRTFSNFPKFGVDGDNAESLRNVLIAYANFNPSLGYCQGMTFIVGVLLMHTDEESAFWIFVQMLKKYRLSTFYQTEEKAGSNIFIQSFKAKLAKTAPELCLLLRGNSNTKRP